MTHKITLLPQGTALEVPQGTSLLSCLRDAGLMPSAPCGGNGHCGKCAVIVDGQQVLSCRTVVDRPLTVTLPTPEAPLVLIQGTDPLPLPPSEQTGCVLALDLGTTTLAACLLDSATGKELASAGRENPQHPYGADVISRIRFALAGHADRLTLCLREGLSLLTRELCHRAGIRPEEIRLVCPVGNPAMVQLLLDLPLDALASPPFRSALTAMELRPAGEILPLWSNAQLLVVPAIGGYVGADTLACLVSLAMDQRQDRTLLVDIGTNGELVLGNQERFVACSTAAGPALEGADIRFGMRAQPGAIDRVWAEAGKVYCHVIGDRPATGICGSGLIDAAATALDLGFLNPRGKLLTPEGRFYLTDQIYLDQEDIRRLQLAKGAIRAGIDLLLQGEQIGPESLSQVFLAGAFGACLDPRSTCRIGLLPEGLLPRITAVGNAACSGATRIALDPEARHRIPAILARTRELPLSTLPEFPRCFAAGMRFKP